MKRKTQIMLIHGGMTFRRRKDYLRYLKVKKISLGKKPNWSGEYLERKLGRDFEIIRPRMPLRENARYTEWKIFFERYIPLLRNNIILVGSSLGGVFLAKYLSENKFPKRILALYLVCPPFDNSLFREELVGGFRLKTDLSLIEKNSPKITFFFSMDDEIVPVAHAEKYRQKLEKTRIIIYKSKNGHFLINSFPEIVKMIRKDARESIEK